MIFSDSPQLRALERMMTTVPRFRPKGGGVMVLHHFEYENFMDEPDSEQEVSVHVEAYLYGEGETFKATPEEVAYFKMRADARLFL